MLERTGSHLWANRRAQPPAESPGAALRVSLWALRALAKHIANTAAAPSGPATECLQGTRDSTGPVSVGETTATCTGAFLTTVTFSLSSFFFFPSCYYCNHCSHFSVSDGTLFPTAQPYAHALMFSSSSHSIQSQYNLAVNLMPGLTVLMHGLVCRSPPYRHGTAGAHPGAVQVSADIRDAQATANNEKPCFFSEQF